MKIKQFNKYYQSTDYFYIKIGFAKKIKGGCGEALFLHFEPISNLGQERPLPCGLHGWRDVTQVAVATPVALPSPLPSQQNYESMCVRLCTYVTFNSSSLFFLPQVRHKPLPCDHDSSSIRSS